MASSLTPAGSGFAAVDSEMWPSMGNKRDTTLHHFRADHPSVGVHEAMDVWLVAVQARSLLSGDISSDFIVVLMLHRPRPVPKYRDTAEGAVEAETCTEGADRDLVGGDLCLIATLFLTIAEDAHHGQHYVMWRGWRIFVFLT
ncbi:unnamed protein product [Nippostrongylus brasiliensis]|uniref:Uncharacterized protein n=1 Tax=Nippostrongylus brasiliensis TaxID=27835 RepID=A0A0N4Y896_NIPBR|nr:unnamed protein product [Nippostrongylus brasiliensis]